MANNHPYVTYYNSPIQIGTGIDNISSLDAGDVVLTQSVTFTDNGTQTIQLPVGASVIQFYADNHSGAPLTAGTIDVLINGTSVIGIAASLSTAVVRTTITNNYAGAVKLNNMQAGANVLSVVIASLAPTPAVLDVTVTYNITVTP